MRPVLSVVAVVRTTDTLGPFAGTIEPRYKSDLGFRIFGRMVARFVDVGAVVKKDDELAALDPAVQALAVRSAEATVANAEAQFANAAAEEGRQRDLAQRNITPQAQFELIQRNRETAEANLTRARASLRKAQDLLSFTQLKADFDGVVTGRYAEPGQVVNAGQKIVTVARPEIREAVIAVPNELADALSHPNAFTMTVDLDHVVSMKAAAVRSIDPDRRSDRPARAASSSPSTIRRPPFASASRSASPSRGRCRRASTCRRPRCSTRTASRSSGWSIRPSSTVALHDVTVLARDDDTVTVTAGSGAAELAAARASSSPACTA